MPDYRLGELFCGPGGLAYGALTANVPGSSITHEWSVDIDIDSCLTYAYNICPDKSETVYCADVRKLNYHILSPVDGLAFGFPCNDFSEAGKQKGLAGEYGPLYTYCVKALRQFRPKWFVAENVKGIQSIDSGKTLNKILFEMQGAGYKVYPHLYSFEDYGVPQMRHRVVIVGIRSDIRAEFLVPAPTTDRFVTCEEALSHPPIARDAPNNFPVKQSARVIERLRYIKPGHNVFDSDLPEHLRINSRGVKISQMYRRLDPSRPAWTVLASSGGGMQMYHWSEDRALTNRERARLQTFPDDYEFIGTEKSVRRQVGMAVPPCGARVIFEALLKTIDGVPYSGVKPNILLEGNL